MKWIGQHIYDYVATFRSAVTMDSTLDVGARVGYDADGVTITDSTASSATQGGKLTLASDDGAATASGHRLGVIEFRGSEDTSGAKTVGARIQCVTDALWASSENGASLGFYTTDGNASQSLVLILDSNKLASFKGAVTIDSTLGFDGVDLTGIQTSAEGFSDDDVSIMTSAAIDDRINTAITAEDLDVAADGDAVIAVDLNSQSLTIAGGTNATTDASGQTVTINVDDAFIKNDAADIMAVSDFGANAALFINADQPATAAAEDSKGLYIDYDRIVAGSGTAAHNDIGIDLDVNSATLGTGTVTGMDIDVVGATSGTHTAIGIDLDVDSADTNIGIQINTAGTHMKLVANADVDDYATLTVADTGDLTIATVGDGTTDSDLTLDADGDITLDAAGGDVNINADTVTFESANADDPQVIIKNTTADNQGARLQMKKDRGAAMVQGDRIGEIDFHGEDASENVQQYSKIIVRADVVTDGQESGKLEFQVANHDGGLGTGLTLVGGSVDAEIDATVGLGTASVTTVAGDLTVTGSDLTFDSVALTAVQTSGESFADNDTSIMTSAAIDDRKVIGQYAVLRATNFYINDNPFVQNSLYFGSSVGNTPGNWNDPQAAGGAITSTSSFTIAEDDMNWGIILPFNISKIEVQCSLNVKLGGTDDFTLAIYTGVRSNASNTVLTLTKVANSSGIVFDANEYVTNDLDYTGDLAKGTMIYVGIGSEDATAAKNGRGYMNITVVRR